MSHLSKADTEERYSLNIDEYLSCLYDEKILIGVYCARYLNAIVKNKPQYLERAVNELLQHREKSAYTDKQEALLDYDILSLFADNFDKLQNSDEVLAFMRNAQASISPKTKKKAKEILKRWGIV